MILKKPVLSAGRTFFFDNLDRIELLGAEVELIPTFIHLAKKYENDPVRMEVVFANPELSSDILELLPLLGKEYYDILLSNLEMFDSLSVLIRRAGTDTASIQSLFSHLDFVDDLIEISNKYAQLKIDGGQRALFLNLDLFEADPGYFLLAQDDPEFFVLLHNSVSLSKVPSTLAYELLELGLNKEELIEVLSDIIEGPLVDEPKSTPPSDDQTQEEIENYNFLNLTRSHVIEGDIDPSLVVSSEGAMASGYFDDFYFAYQELNDLEGYDYYDEEHSESVHFDYDGEEQSIDQYESYREGILGGSEILVLSGEYDLSGFDYDSLVFAASDSLSLAGEITFNGSQKMREALFVSAGSISIEEGSSIEFVGESLGIGSFDSLEIINVELKAEEQIGIRSLDNLVINNSDLITTNGLGSDFVHLMAYEQIELNNLRFSEQVRQISMEAMTINLRNINFPENSMVYLSSEYGPIEGKYPNFGKSVPGRVNFIENVRYNSHLLNSTISFDNYGANIYIGKISR